MSQGDVSVFWSSPIAISLWILVLVVMALGSVGRLWKRAFTSSEKAVLTEGD